MCVVSTKLKLCTCKTSNPLTLQHYWILSRFTGPKDTICIGEVKLPESMYHSNYNINQNILLTLLNSGEVFDVPIKIKTKDVLEVVINNLSADTKNCFTYDFEFNKGSWIKARLKPFDLENCFVSLKFGKITSAINR